jgi:DNA segregation ATPase FtsK/SpoIIIE, S-DNA-T family
VEADEKYDEAVALVTRTRQASISMVQRHLRIGYNRAARIIEMMEKEGVVGPSDGAKPREVLVGSYDNLP